MIQCYERLRALQELSPTPHQIMADLRLIQADPNYSISVGVLVLGVNVGMHANDH